MATILDAGCVIEGYRIAGLHAAGGMSTVYRAEHVETHRRVALKVSSPRFADSLARERAALSVIASPHVIRCLGRGETHDGLQVLVLDWLDGDDLRAVLARSTLATDDAVRIATELCTALAAVHAAGYVHRDVKPANLSIAPDGRTTLFDFGLAQRTGLDRLSRLGTAAYLAPELTTRPGHAMVDPRSDVYSVGCVLFECLAGEPPFRAGNAAEILLRHLLEPAPRVRTLRADVPAWLDDLVALLLRKEIADATGLSKSAVQAAIRRLARRKLLTAKRTHRTARPEYTVHRPWAD